MFWSVFFAIILAAVFFKWGIPLLSGIGTLCVVFFSNFFEKNPGILTALYILGVITTAAVAILLSYGIFYAISLVYPDIFKLGAVLLILPGGILYAAYAAIRMRLDPSYTTR